MTFAACLLASLLACNGAKIDEMNDTLDTQRGIIGDQQAAMTGLQQQLAGSQQRIAALEAQIAALQDRVEASEDSIVDLGITADVHDTRIEEVQDDLEQLQLDIEQDARKIEDHERDLLSLDDRLDETETTLLGVNGTLDPLLAILSLDDQGDLVLEGANLWIRSGAGTTDAEVNGKGNLIIGYGETDGTQARTGSHNLVVGPWHAWSSYGTVLFGFDNATTAPYASICGGRLNTVSGVWGTVLGGAANALSAQDGAIHGGCGISDDGDSCVVLP